MTNPLPCPESLVPPHDWPEALLVPQGAELQAVRRGLRRVGSPLPIIPIAIGPGPTGMRIAAAIASGQLRSGMRVLAMGLAGGLGPLAVGDRLIYRRCDWVDGGGDLDRQGQHWLASRLPEVTIGVAWSSDRLVGTAALKQALHAKTQALVVDMETSALVESLGAAGIALGVVRVVSDDGLTSLPDLAGTVDGDGGWRPLALAGAFVRQPIGAAALIRGSLRGLAALEATVVVLFG